MTLSEELEDPKEFAKRLEANPKDVLTEEFNRYRDRLWRIVNFRLNRKLHGRIDSDDVLQEAFINATTRIEHYIKDPSTTFFIWLRTIVGQTVIDFHRRHLVAKKRDARREISANRMVFSASTSFEIADILLAQITSPTQATVKKEVAAQLHDALEGLNEIDREILVLRHFEELANAEAAEVLNIEPKTASMRYFRALARLRSVLERIPGLMDWKK